MDQPLIDILLPTYNGSKYIRVLLDSLLAQTHQNWRLLIRDDHSSDNTLEIVNEYIKAHPEKIILVDNEGKNIGINKGFSKLLSLSASDYTCFCDQDDKWMEDKLEVSLNAIRKLEKQLPGKPCLVYSDLCLADDKLNVIAASRNKEENFKPHYTSLPKLLVQTPVNGCVMMMNKPLVELALPVDPKALWYDHWVALLAAATGKVEYIDRTTIYYRIHEFNASIGENRVTKTKEEGQLSRKISNKNFKDYFRRLEDQAKAVHKRIKETGLDNEKANNVLNDFLAISTSNPVKRRWILLKHKIFKHSWFTTFKWFVRI